MATKNPEVTFKAWLGHDAGTTGSVWSGAGELVGGYWHEKRDVDYIAGLSSATCKLARDLLKHVASSKRRRVEITVKFI